MTPGLSSSNDASMAETQDLQIVTIGQFKDIVEQMNIGQAVFNKKLKDIGKAKVKLLKVYKEEKPQYIRAA